jgi:hypothetical protein
MQNNEKAESTWREKTLRERPEWIEMFTAENGFIFL